MTYGIAAALAGMAGTMVGMVGTFNPSNAAGHTLLSFVIAVLGGLGNIYGAHRRPDHRTGRGLGRTVSAGHLGDTTRAPPPAVGAGTAAPPRRARPTEPAVHRAGAYRYPPPSCSPRWPAEEPQKRPDP
ncbi:hypothetical protein ACNAW0_24685 [Micromonospora sp. SL1-18]|uniref:hypothetical protein n=1 Tax=Micromonospora sp. SL1-18 TaxID=3399128 RepID=UPI003A4DC5EC